MLILDSLLTIYSPKLSSLSDHIQSSQIVCELSPTLTRVKLVDANQLRLPHTLFCTFKSLNWQRQTTFYYFMLMPSPKCVFLMFMQI